MAHLMDNPADVLEIMEDDDDRKAATSRLRQTSTRCQGLQQTTEKNALGRQSNGQGHTFGVRSCDVECGLHTPAVVVAAKLITKPCALIGAPRPWLTTEALSVGGNN
ncbi:hypothetical protein V502_08296 [Pseudogymnoascus sp. VKM F-4520 (FW-2644)]|nr:hypothetical protein V502_08296 [Pseudogymnoascus sp. VKM F-4520 (FW-2644)]